MNAFELYLRTGRRSAEHGPIQLKFNPWHDAEDGQFTFKGQGRYFAGRGGSGGGAGATAKGDWTPKKRPQPVRPQRQDRFRGGGGSFGGAGATGGGWTDKRAVKPAVQPRLQISSRSIKPRTATPQPQLKRVSRNGYDYEIDSIGRTRRASGTITLNPKQGISKPTQLRAGGADRLPSDQGGHYIARQFNGPTEAFSHFAQDANFNKSRYAKLEHQWKKMTRRGKRVSVDIKPQFEGNSQRPSEIIVLYRIGSKTTRKVFPNRSGVR